MLHINKHNQHACPQFHLTQHPFSLKKNYKNHAFLLLISLTQQTILLNSLTLHAHSVAGNRFKHIWWQVAHCGWSLASRTIAVVRWPLGRSAEQKLLRGEEKLTHGKKKARSCRVMSSVKAEKNLLVIISI